MPRGTTVLPDLVQDDGPGDGGKEKQDQEHTLRQERRVGKKLKEIDSAGPSFGLARARRLQREGEAT